MDNPIDQVQDVTQPVETETTVAPSSEEQTTQSTPVQDESGESKETSKFVPYDRFEEVNTGYKQSRETIAQLQAEVDRIKGLTAGLTPPDADPQKDAIRKELEAMGFVTKEQQAAELKQQQLDASTRAELTRLESGYDGKDGRPKFDRNKVVSYAIEHSLGNLETAYKEMHEQELIDWHVQKAIANSKGTKSEASNGSGSSEVGTTNEDLKKAIEQGDRNALKTYLKRQFRG
jgi:hypothetical protein